MAAEVPTRHVMDILPHGKLMVAENGARGLSPIYRMQSKALGLFFAAGWDGPSRQAMAALSDWYDERVAAKGGSLRGKLEIVYIGSDASEDEFRSFCEGMPWLALAHDAQAAKDELRALLAVPTIPTLVFLDNKGAIMTRDGRFKVRHEPDGWPWAE